MSQSGNECFTSPSPDAAVKRKATLAGVPQAPQRATQKKQEDYKQSKPFQKRYGHPQGQSKQDQTSLSQQVIRQPHPQHRVSSVKGVEMQQRVLAKQTFNERLKNNIIKDELNELQDTPSSRQSFRIKKVDSRSPKKVRDDLVHINDEEFRLQRQIMLDHKRFKASIDSTLTAFHLPKKDLLGWLGQVQQLPGDQAGSLSAESSLQYLSQLNKIKGKQLQKHQRRITDNAFTHYLEELPLPKGPISEMASSEQEDDVVAELPPPDRPRLEANLGGGYSLAMASIKNKGHGLNMRRTYEIFKQSSKECNEDKKSVSSEVSQAKQQVLVNQGQNRMTLNNKFKDFLLN